VVFTLDLTLTMNGRSFNRWEAGQKLFTRTILSNVAAAQAGVQMTVGSMLVEAVRRTLADAAAERSLKAYALTLPALATMAEEMSEVDPEALAAATKFTRRGLALALRGELEAAYAANVLPVEPFRADREAIGMRRLKNTCLGYLAAIEDGPTAALCLKQAKESAGCMTDVLSATAALASCEGQAASAAREEALALFYERHAKGNALLFCKWLMIQVRWSIFLIWVHQSSKHQGKSTHTYLTSCQVRVV
jgi:aminopeptidase N